LRAAAAGLLLLATPAAAQITCGPEEQVTQTLTIRYQEQPALTGVTGSGDLMQMWVAPNGLTWSVTLSNGAGVCIIAAGRSLERVALKPKDKPS
jgi:hypothetical protein